MARITYRPDMTLAVHRGYINRHKKAFVHIDIAFKFRLTISESCQDYFKPLVVFIRTRVKVESEGVFVCSVTQVCGWVDIHATDLALFPRY